MTSAYGSSDPRSNSDPRSIAVRTALEVLLTPQQIARAMQLWQEKYARQATFSVQYFVRECCTLCGVEALRNQLVQNLVRELNRQRASHVEERVFRAQAETGDDEQALQVFQLLFRALMDAAGPLRGREISRYVADSLPAMTLSKDVRASLDLWLRQNMPVIEASVPQPVLTELVNRAYIGLCEYCGPVKADHILNDVVNRVATTPAGQAFHPQQLL